MYTINDSKRELHIEESSEVRSPYRRDYGRLIHCPAFRRLQGKTQLYPGIESDFFRNRLTHSLEVGQIAKSIAITINSKFLKDDEAKHIDPDICEFAGLAHDLGHPPFGHQGEEALDECMRELGGFEGNAQTLRILSRIEKKEKSESATENQEFRYGLNLTYRTLASILKYDNIIPEVSEDRTEENRSRAVKGYYKTEADLVSKIKNHVAGAVFDGKFKTVECQIMDIADDIAYSTYDLEAGFKAGFYHPTTFFSYPSTVFENVAKKVSRAIEGDFTAAQVQQELFVIFASVYNFGDFSFHDLLVESEEYVGIKKDDAFATLANVVNLTTKASKSVAEDGYIRNRFTSELVDTAIDGVRFEYNSRYPALSKVWLEEKTKIRVEVLKNFTYESQILSPRLKVAEFRGKEIVKEIFNAISTDEGWLLMPMDYQNIYHHFTDIQNKRRCVCDYVAGMTDKYAIEFYGRLKSESPETIFKPF